MRDIFFNFPLVPYCVQCTNERLVAKVEYLYHKMVYYLLFFYVTNPYSL